MAEFNLNFEFVLRIEKVSTTIPLSFYFSTADFELQFADEESIHAWDAMFRSWHTEMLRSECRHATFESADFCPCLQAIHSQHKENKT